MSKAKEIMSIVEAKSKFLDSMVKAERKIRDLTERASKSGRDPSDDAIASIFFTTVVEDHEWARTLTNIYNEIEYS